MKKLFFVLLIGLGLTSITKAQDVLDGVYIKEHVPSRKPVPYHHIREADMAWGKKIWRVLDLKEKMNHPLYYPIKKMDDRYSFVELVLYGVENEGLVVYGTMDDEFTAPVTIKEINTTAFGAGKDSTYVTNPETGQDELKYTDKPRKSEEVVCLLMKEFWFFDKQRAMLECRIIGLCPIREFVKEATTNNGAVEATANKTEGEGEGDDKELVQKQVCWVYFPSARPLLANHEVFNAHNDTERRTFDDIFFKRRFSSYIFQETNQYENRRINEFKFGLDALVESDRIKNMLFTFEHDLFEY